MVAHKRALHLEGLDAADDLREAQNRQNERQAQGAFPEIAEDISHSGTNNKRKEVDEEEPEAKRLFCLYDVVHEGRSEVSGFTKK